MHFILYIAKLLAEFGETQKHGSMAVFRAL